MLTHQHPPHPMEAPKANHDMELDSSSLDKRDEGDFKAPHTKKLLPISSQCIAQDENRVDDDTKFDADLAHVVKDLTNTFVRIFRVG